MDPQVRGQLLVGEEEAQKEIERIRKELSKAGDILFSLGNRVKNKPEEVTFSNAPDSLGSVSTEYHLLRTHSFDWNDIPDKKHVAELIQELRAKMSELNNIQRQLGR